MTATLIGETFGGALGTLPLVRVATRKPKLKNNGFNCFHGQPDMEVPGLEEALKEADRPIAQGWVKLQYNDGSALLYAANTKHGGEKFSFH